MNQRILVIPLLVLIMSATGWIGYPLPTQVTSGQPRSLKPGDKVTVRNLLGNITIRGWDRDTIEAKAADESEEESVPVQIAEDAKGLLISPNERSGRHGGEIELQISLPRFVQLSASTRDGNVEVSGIDGSVSAQSGSGDLRISKVGTLNATTGSGDASVETVSGSAVVASGSGDVSLNAAGSAEIRAGSGDIALSHIKASARIESSSGNLTATRIQGDFVAKLVSGDVELKNVGGLVNVTTTGGSVRIQDAGGDIRVVSISGDLNIECARGRVELSSASGSIALTGISNDLEASTTSGDVAFRGKIREGGRYRLKTTSGSAEMIIQSDAPGFTATLSSYSGEIETDFPLTVESSLQRGPMNRRIIGRYGDGKAQIALDSFSSTVGLRKSGESLVKNCE